MPKWCPWESQAIEIRPRRALLRPRSSSGPTCCARSPAASPASSTRSGRASRWPMAAARSACLLLPRHRHRPPRPLRGARPAPPAQPAARPQALERRPRPPRPPAPHRPRRGALRLRRARAGRARPPRDPRRRAPARLRPVGHPERRSPGTAEVGGPGCPPEIGSPGSTEGRPSGPAEGRPCRGRRRASVVVEAVPQRPRLLPRLTRVHGRFRASRTAFDSMRRWPSPSPLRHLAGLALRLRAPRADTDFAGPSAATSATAPGSSTSPAG